MLQQLGSRADPARGRGPQPNILAGGAPIVMRLQHRAEGLRMATLAIVALTHVVATQFCPRCMHRLPHLVF